jgi:hypothetical protein
MADQEWTVKELTEALKRFPVDAKVYYNMGRTGPKPSGKRNTRKPGATPQRWEFC